MKKVYQNRAMLFFLFGTVFIVFLSCAKTQEPLRPDEGVKSAVKTSADEDAVKQSAVRAEGAAADIAAVTEPGGNDFLLFSDKLPEALIAEDFEIGRLQAGFGNDEITADIISTAGQFLRSLMSGSVDSKLLSSEKKVLVQRMIDDGLSAAVPAGYRIGEIDSSGSPAWAAVRIYGENGWSTGYLYFVREGGWKIYDFHLDFNELNITADHENKEWVPEDRKKN